MRCTGESIGRFRGASWSGLLLLAVMAAMLLAGLALPAPHVYATSYPCTDAGLNTAIAAGGSASFNCAGPTTVPITGTKVVTNTLTLDGGGLLTISGGNTYQVFIVSNNIAFTVQNLTIVNGKASGGSGGGISVGVGATMTVTNCIFSDNSASNGGGAIYTNGTLLSVTNSTLASNTAPFGGGINSNTGTTTVTNSIFSDNTAANVGGGIVSSGTLSVTNSTLANNTARFGGGILNSGTTTVTNSTFSGNSAVNNGGGIANSGVMSVTNSTLAGNSASGSGGGIHNNFGTLSVTNSTLSGNSASGTGGGGIRNAGGPLNLTDSLVVNNGASNDLADIAPAINSHNITGTFTFADASPAIPGAHGGPTATLALPFGSPAIDSGVCLPTYTDAVTGTVLTVTTDGRGIARPQGNGCDIGAFESTGFPLTHTGGAQSAAVTTAFAQPLTVTVTANDPGVTTSGIAITFTAPAAGASGTFTNGTTTATVTTSANGVATAPAFTANTAAGSYTVIANIPAGGGVAARFDLTNTPSVAASITAISGGGGSAQIGTAFTAPLTVQVRDSHGNPAPNAVVTFTLPTGTNIPTVTLSSPTAITDASGYASVTATAAVRPGTLTITATVPGGSSPASFGLTNIAALTTLTLTTISPPTGPITGGTVVTLHGTNLDSVTAVSFGGTPGTLGGSMATSLTVTAPAHAAGTVDISVTTGTQTAVIHGYTYLDVGSIAPQPQPGGHPPAGNVVVGGSAPMAQPGRR